MGCLSHLTEHHIYRSDVSKCRVSFFGVFDGHGGCNTAKMACEILHNKVMKAGLVEHEVRCFAFQV